MPPLKNRIGERYGRLVVIAYHGFVMKNYKKCHLWLCKCDCGNTKVVSSDNLSSGKSNSCGCLKVEELLKNPSNFKNCRRIQDREEAIFKRLYSALKKRHNKLGFQLDNIITFDTFCELSKKPCYYCGKEWSREVHDRAYKKGSHIKDTLLSDKILHINGLDRVDPSKGYVEGNVVPCCTTCNTAKHIMSLNEFLQWVSNIYNNLQIKHILK